MIGGLVRPDRSPISQTATERSPLCNLCRNGETQATKGVSDYPACRCESLRCVSDMYGVVRVFFDDHNALLVTTAEVCVLGVILRPDPTFIYT